MDKKYEELEVLFRKYRENVSDYAFVLESVKKLEKQLHLHESGNIETKDESIEGLSIQSPTLSDIPKSETNKFTSTTESVAINYLHYLQPSVLEIKAIKAIIAEKQTVLEQLADEIKIVDNLLISLTDQERFVIEHLYIKGLTYKQTILNYNKTFEQSSIYWAKTLWYIRKRAFTKMQKRML